MNRIRIEIKWAVVFLIVSLLWMVFEKLCGLHSTHIDKHQYLTMLFMIPAIWIYVLALKDKKKNYYNGNMNFWQGFLSGMVISLIITLFSPFTQWIISTIITPEYFPNVIEYSLKTGYHQTRAEAEAYFSLKNYMVQSTVGVIMMGTITSLIVAFFIKSKTRPEPERS